MQDVSPARVKLPAFLESQSGLYSNSLIPAPPRRTVKREAFIGFVRDEPSAALLHTALAGHIPNSNQVHLADFNQALTILAGIVTPEIVLVDLSGEDQPMNALMNLADVVDPGTVVLAVGEVQNVNFYRTVVRTMGVSEYLAKPLNEEVVTRYFLPLIDKRNGAVSQPRGGEMIALCAARGGVGCSTVAANLGWYMSEILRRHTVLMDGDVNYGTLALNLDIPASRGLAAVLESPERMDQLLVERCVFRAGDRLDVIAGQEALDWAAPATPEAVAQLLEAIRPRYNYMVADIGARLSPLSRALLFNAQRRVIVLDPTEISLRHAQAWMSLPGGSAQAPRPLLLLNKAGMQGGLPVAYIEDRLGQNLAVLIPDLPREVGGRTTAGTLAARPRGPYRAGIAALAKALEIALPSTLAPAQAA